jgi:sensor histidine kinase YesM
VENAILHGLKQRKDDKGKLAISVQRTEDGIDYTVTDNGIGRVPTIEGQKNGKASYGMQMSRDRIMLFNQEEKASVRITDLQENGIPSGTKVEIKLRTA